MARCTVLIPSLLAFTSAVAWANGTARRDVPILRTVEQIRNLGHEPSGTPHRVILRSVVTCFDRERGLMFVQDRTAGVFVEDAGRLSARNGDSILLHGEAAYPDYSPEIAGAQVR